MSFLSRALGKVAQRDFWRRLLAARFDDGSGLPPAERALERAGSALAWVATAFIGVIGLWEIGGPFGAGHYAASTAVAVGGENMWRLGTIAPVLSYLPGPPTNADYYCHHPFGTFWTGAIFSALFGHHAWVARLPAVIFSTLMPRVIFGGGRALYGPLAGGLGALAYVVVPITLAFANFFALEVPTMFGMALATYGYARFAQSEQRRFAVLALAGLGYAAACDWTGFLFDGLVLGGLFVRGFLLRRFVPGPSFERLASFWANAVVVVGALALLHFGMLVKLEHVDELLRQGEFRSFGSDQPLSAVLHARRYWLALAFTPLVIVLGKLAAPLLVLRLLVGRRELELFPLAILVTAILQYVVFKQGADIHFFWPQYFALYFAYAVGALFATLERWGTWALVRRPKRTGTPSEIAWSARARALPWLLAATGCLALGAVLPDALRNLTYARKSGGRFNERGLIIHPDFDKAAALELVARTTPKESTLGVASSMQASYWVDWLLERPVRQLGLPRVGPSGVRTFALDTRFDSRGAIETLTREFAVRAIGPFLVADTEAPAHPVDGFAIVPRRLGALTRWFTATTHDSYEVVPAPYWTWELRNILNQAPNPEPQIAPATPDDLRVAYNLAVWNGDAPRAQSLRAQLFAGIDTHAKLSFTGGVEFLGSRLEHGDTLRLTLYFESQSPLPGDVQFHVTSSVEAPPRLSLVPKDELSWEVGMPFAIPTSLWRPGFVYTSVTELVRRPGRERYEGAFRGPLAPTPLTPRAPRLLVLE